MKAHQIELKEICLGDIANIESGQGAPQGTQWFQGEKIFVRAGDLNKLSNGVFVGDYCKRITEEAVKKYSLRLFPKNSVVFPKSGMSIMTENIAILKYDSYVVNHLAVIKVNDIIDAKYLFYLLRRLKISTLVKNPGYPSIRLSDIQNFKVFWASKFVREKIVLLLDKAERARELRKEADVLTKHLLDAVFLDMFGDPQVNNKKWSNVKIGDCIEYAQYGTSAKSNVERKGYPVIGMNHISIDGDIDMSEFNYVDLQSDEFEKLKLHEGDVLFNRTNSPELIGKTTCWNKSIDAVAASYLVKLKMKDNCNPIFFARLMNTKYFRRFFYSRSKKAVNQANISPTLLKTFTIYLPPVTLQNKFAAIVQRIEKIKGYQKLSEIHHDELFNNLMQKAFKGEIIC